MLDEGARLFERAARRSGSRRAPPGPPRPDRAPRARQEAARPRPSRRGTGSRRRDAARSRELLEQHPLRELVTRSDRHPLLVDRQRALYGSWYEFFPRSEGAQFDPMGRRRAGVGNVPHRRRGCRAIAEMGFDVVYLPPIHPIGSRFRKGPTTR